MTIREGKMDRRFKSGDTVLVRAIVSEVHDMPTNWPIRIVLDRGASETIDLGGNVHFSAIERVVALADGE